MSPELIGILSVGVTLLVGLLGLGGLIVGLSPRLHSELRSDVRQFREENSRQHGELAARIDALNARVDGLNARVDGLSAQP
ncbi:MAG: hypothetical protein OXG65_11190 [Chloroflexi bacterium]|nr:hypothetical protein [Chloroflexota bacterium]